MRRLHLAFIAFVSVCALALALLTIPDEGSARVARDRAVLKKIVRLKHVTWRWQHLMSRPRTRVHLPAATHRTRLRLLRRWRLHATQALRQAHHPPHLSSWLCIHRFEGSWAANTGNGYYGGLQMDWSFQRAYGLDLLRRKGTADRWTPLEQMWVAERAHRSGRGFSPWPNTARSCGVL